DPAAARRSHHRAPAAHPAGGGASGDPRVARCAARPRPADGRRGRLAGGPHRSRLQPALGLVPARGPRELAVRRAGQRLGQSLYLAGVELRPVLAAALLPRAAPADAARDLSRRARALMIAAPRALTVPRSVRRAPARRARTPR